MNPSANVFLCFACQQSKKREDFSNSQLKNHGGRRKCKVCVANDGSNSASSAIHQPAIMTAPGGSSFTPTSIAPLPSTLPAQPQPQQQFQAQVLFQQPAVVPVQLYQALQQEHDRLKSENLSLRNHIDMLGFKIQELGLPVDTIRRLEESEALIEILQKENEALKRENTDLKSKIKDLENKIDQQQLQIKKLTKSFEVENKLAIRSLISDAKNCDSSRFPKQIWKYIHNKKLKNEVNAAAHQFSSPRIFEAIKSETQPQKKEFLMSIFNVVHADYVEDESSDEEFCFQDTEKDDIVAK